MNKLRKVFIYFLYLYIIALPILPGKYKLGGIPINGDSILAFIIVFYFIKLIIDKKSRNNFIRGFKELFKDYLNVFILLWIAMMYISIFYAKDRALAVSETIRFTTYAVLYFIIRYDIDDKKILDNILKLYIFVSMAIGSIGIIEALDGIGTASKGRLIDVTRVASTLENANNLGVFFILAVFPLFMLCIKEKNRCKKAMYLVFILIALTNIVFSGSRNAILALIVGMLSLLIMYSLKSIVFFIVAGGLALIIPKTNHLIRILGDKFQDPSRIKLWEIALYIIKDHPILGVGNGNYRSYYPMYEKKVSNIDYVAHDNFHPHSIYLKAQCELGIVGFISLIGLLISSVIRILKFSSFVEDKFYKYFYKGFAASIIAFMFMNAIDNFFSAPKVIAYFWIILAVAECYKYNIKNIGTASRNFNI